MCSQGAEVYDEIPNYDFCQCRLPQALATLWVGENRHMGWSGRQLPVVVGWGKLIQESLFLRRGSSCKHSSRGVQGVCQRA